MFSVALVNAILSLWVKPMVVLALGLSIIRYSFQFSAAAKHWFFASIVLVMAFSSLVMSGALRLDLAIVSLSFLSWLQSLIVLVPYLLELIVGLYVLGVFWVLFYQASGFVQISGITRRAAENQDGILAAVFRRVCSQMALRKRIFLKISDNIEGPIVWGAIRPTILLPRAYRQWSHARLARVLAHECAHIERHDWLIKLSCKWVCAAFWPVPLVWFYMKKIEWFAELACDDRVVALYDCRAEYAQDLLSISTDKDKLSWALAFIRSSELFYRVQYVLDGRNQRSGVTKTGGVLQLLTSIVLIFPIMIFSVSAFVPPQGTEFVLAASPVNVMSDISVSRENFLAEEIPSLEQMKGLISLIPSSSVRMEELIVSYQDEFSHQVPTARLTLPSSEIVEPDSLNAAFIPIPLLEIKGVLPQQMAMPVYPRKALLRGVEGRVVVSFDVDENGIIVNEYIIDSSPPKIFDRAVLAALKKSKFTPMQMNGRPVIARKLTETFTFKVVDSSHF